MPAKKKAASKKEAQKPVSAKKEEKVKSVLDLMMESEKDRNVRHIELRVAEAEDFLSTGVLSFDLILGGGYFGGRIMQIFGRPGVGKSTLGYTSTGCLTRQKVPTQMQDFEGTTTKDYRERLARITDGDEDIQRYFRYVRPSHGPEGYAMMLDFLKKLPDKDSGMPQACFLVDTIATMPTEGEMADWDKSKRMAQRAAMHSEWMGRIKLMVAKKHISIIALNQVRADPSPYGSMVRPGGNAWEFATDNLVYVKGGKTVEVDGEVYQPMSFKTFKNKNYKSMQEAEVFLHLGHGIDPASDVIEFLKLTGCLKMVQVKKTKVPVIEGLDGHNSQYRSINFLTGMIRAQADAGEESFVEACQKMLRSGEAIKRWEAHKKLKAIKANPEMSDSDAAMPPPPKSKAGEARAPAEDAPTTAQGEASVDGDGLVNGESWNSEANVASAVVQMQAQFEGEAEGQGETSEADQQKAVAKLKKKGKKS
jgi:RecA/RadA recombinase